MKTVYLVRHGETEANIKKVWQDEFDELSSVGLMQAGVLAKRLKNINLDKGLVSTMKRAVQTSEVIINTIGLQFEMQSYFREPKVPTSTVGTVFKPEIGNACFDYVTARDANNEDSDFRYEDEETLNEIITRVNNGIQYLDSLEEQNILVVTHGTILRTIISVILHQNLNASPFLVFSAGRNFETVNASITVIRKIEDKPWTVLTFNDHAHFAE